MSSNSWSETLSALRQDLEPVRAERLRRAQERDVEEQRLREQLVQLDRDLGTRDLLSEMNRVLLDGKGALEVITSWEEEAEPENEGQAVMDTDEEEEGDLISVVLSWEEDGERELAVDLGLAEDGIYLQVNGVEIRQERAALEDALIQGFRDELEV